MSSIDSNNTPQALALCLHSAAKVELLSFHSDQCVFVCMCTYSGAKRKTSAKSNLSWLRRLGFTCAEATFHLLDGKNENIISHLIWRGNIARSYVDSFTTATLQTINRGNFFLNTSHNCLPAALNQQSHDASGGKH